jgi:hypothetical protein
MVQGVSQKALVASWQEIHGFPAPEVQTGSEYSPLVRFCENSNEPSRSIKPRDLLTNRVIINVLKKAVRIDQVG